VKISEFEEFYKYITALNITENEGEIVDDLKTRYQKELLGVPIELAMKKAKEVYGTLLVPCNLNQLNPKVFSGENPNPGLYGRPEKEDRFYM